MTLGDYIHKIKKLTNQVTEYDIDNIEQFKAGYINQFQELVELLIEKYDALLFTNHWRKLEDTQNKYPAYAYLNNFQECLRQNQYDLTSICKATILCLGGKHHYHPKFKDFKKLLKFIQQQASIIYEQFTCNITDSEINQPLLTTDFKTDPHNKEKSKIIIRLNQNTLQFQNKTRKLHSGKTPYKILDLIKRTGKIKFTIGEFCMIHKITNSEDLNSCISNYRRTINRILPKNHNINFIVNIKNNQITFKNIYFFAD